MEKSKSKLVADIVVTYGVAVVSIIVAFTLGAYSLAGRYYGRHAQRLWHIGQWQHSIVNYHVSLGCFWCDYC